MMRPRLSLLLAATVLAGLSAPAIAQMDHSNMPGMTMPPAKKPAAKKPTAQQPAAKKPAASSAKKKGPAADGTRKAAAKPSCAKTAADPHAGHDMSQVPSAPAGPAQAADPHAGHDMSQMPASNAPAQATDPHAGHDMPMAGETPAGHDMSQMPAQPAAPTEADDPHAGHDMSTMEQRPTGEAVGTDLPAGTSPPPPIPAEWAADRVYDPAAMEMGRHHLRTFHGGQKFVQVLWNVAEYQFRKGRDGYEWDGEGWYGGDINRLWVKSEGEGAFGEGLEKAEVQALYSRAIDPYWNVQAGLRYDFKPNPSRVYATIGLEGLAPSFFDVEGALFLSNKGELMARAEGSYDQRITQRLILQPRAEINFAAQNSREIGVGAGLSDAEVGVRLRYDIRREFAPYLGVQYRRAFGRTRDYLRAEGEDAAGWSFLAGIRTWF
jgi:copper resistance protein B